MASKANNIHFYGWENPPKVLILVSNDNRNANGCQDASRAAGNMLFVAHSYGLGAVWLNTIRNFRDVYAMAWNKAYCRYLEPHFSIRECELSS